MPLWDSWLAYLPKDFAEEHVRAGRLVGMFESWFQPMLDITFTTRAAVGRQRLFR
jgi:hypothetical protein